MAEAAHDANGAGEALSQDAATAAAAAAAVAAAAAAGAAAASGGSSGTVSSSSSGTSSSSTTTGASATTNGESSKPAVPPVEIKLFIGRVPQSIEEEQLKPVFQEFGEVREVIIIRDKATAKHKNSAFVKMASISAADSAIKALHNTRVLESAMGPMTVKYATGEAERLGLNPQACEPGVPQAKLFVGSLPRSLKEEELKAFFLNYGTVEEVFIMKDSATGQGRGCAFVKMSSKEEAFYAINSLNGKHVWEGCSRPMEVRFAESRAQRQQMLSASMGMNAGGRVGGAVNMRAGLGPAGGSMMNMRMTPGVSGAAAAAAGSSSNSNPRAAGPWKEYFSAEGRPYYHNELTGITTWERPVEFMQAPPPVPPAAAAGYASHMNSFATMQHTAQQTPADDAAAGGRDQSGPPGSNIFVFHVPNEWSSADLLNSFSQFGVIISARVAIDRQTGRNKGYGFVSYDSPEAAAAAVAAMNGFLAGGKRLKVTIKKGEEQHALRASPGAFNAQSGPGSLGAAQQQTAARDQQWGTPAAGYAVQTAGSSYAPAGGFPAAGAPPQQQRFAPY